MCSYADIHCKSTIDVNAQDMMGLQSVPEGPQRNGGMLAMDLICVSGDLKGLQGLSVKD